MGDREIVAVVAGNPAGLAAAYDNYAASLHAYCRSLLAEPADAADAVQDTFVVAAARLGGLRDRDRLRPWLYAVARNECYGRLRDQARRADLDNTGEMAYLAAEVSVDDDIDAGTPAEREERRGLVLDAIGGMSPGDREIIELNLRHDLSGSDLAEVLGVSASQANALASRTRGQLERSLGALLVARTDRRQCAELDALLDSWDGRLTILRRKRVARHIEGCQTCGARKLLELSPAMLLSALPLVPLPADLRRQVLWLVSDSSADAVSYRARVVDRAEPFSPSGFPVQIAPADQGTSSHRAGDEDGFGGPGTGSRLRSRAFVLAAVALVILLIGGGAAAHLILGSKNHPAAGGRPAAGASQVIVSPSLSATGPASGRSARPSSGRSRPSSPAAHSSSPSPAASRSSPGRSSSPPTRPSPTAGPTHTAIGATLSESPDTVALTQDGGPYSATFTLTASGAPVSFAVSVPASESYLSVSPASGTLGAGHSQRITVTLTPNGHKTPYSSRVTAGPGGLAVTVLYPPSA
jgi:RNA polymerase sigma factor (sigma-70 family)